MLLLDTLLSRVIGTYPNAAEPSRYLFERRQWILAQLDSGFATTGS